MLLGVEIWLAALLLLTALLVVVVAVQSVLAWLRRRRASLRSEPVRSAVEQRSTA